MLKLNLEPTFTATLSLTVPGKKEPGELSLTFRYMGLKEYAEWVVSSVEKKNDEGEVIRPMKSNVAAFMEFVVGWEFKEEFSKANVETFLNNYPAAFAEILGAYCDFLLESRLKN